jgi:hypothetical protein
MTKTKQLILFTKIITVSSSRTALPDPAHGKDLFACC